MPAHAVALNLPVREPWAGDSKYAAQIVPATAYQSHTIGCVRVIDCGAAGLLWFAVMITSAWRRPLTKILLDRVRDESGE
jgi:hypothetical protein